MHALITGSSSGIGEAMARYLADQGWDLTLVARREDQLRELARNLKVRTLICSADLNGSEICAEIVSHAEAKLGPVDVLINNAGIQYVEPTVNVEPVRIKRLLNVDLVSPLVLIHEVLPSMLERGAGTLVNITSVAALTPTPGMCHYNAAKAGLAATSESLRVELKATGVHVLTVYPGPVNTTMAQAAKAAYQDSPFIRALPTGDADILARLVHRSIVKKRSRLFYPRVFLLHRYARVLNQWLTDRFVPPLRDRADIKFDYQSGNDSA